ncbi:hypothetical protein NNJEOMEG_00735 [Fundidesulfovibrio magnetotacticus]|uniref:SGNH hydrolase-type esterase domain-containing protein n=1 Tax=Fundidesulfovibrio magnetotacticus TaxID=2730080 RepID=A0A6V8LTE2_9BACT|nr:GDSL-type esterase/lipase family protein [Fundidesulfovibrio magnetotacticus]GFK92907.1 hypothetical protein NNJEOMEG_00735 [Fundidesulfovibrio magnetotacticus]
MLKRLLKLAALPAYVYLLLLACSTGLYCSTNLLRPLLAPGTWEQLVSLDILDLHRHPQYRDWLGGFVHAQGQQPDRYYPDTHAFHGIPYDTIPLDDDPVDPHGYKNALRPDQARVLFTGDSFAVGGGVGSRLAAPAVYARLTGCPVYNASMGGYGLAHYPRIVRHFTRDLPPDRRFTGRDVVVLSYMGNDLTLDMDVNLARQEREADRLGYLLRLGPLRRLAALALGRVGPGLALAAEPGMDGYAVAPLRAPTWQGIPFSFHLVVKHMLTLENFRRNIPAIRETLARLKALESPDLRIHVAAIPTGLQVVRGDIDTARLDPASSFAREYRTIAANLDAMQDEFLALCREAGLEALDTRPALLADPARSLLYYPHDTHMTAQGQDVLARIIRDAWPQVARDCAPLQ